MDFPIAEIDEKYEVIRKLAEGGMGAVYVARHRLLDELRVIKTIRPHLAQRADLRQRFHREARASIKLRHPHIAQIYDFVLGDDDVGYSVMELVEGLTLKQVLRPGPPPQAFSIEVACQTLQALGYLHSQGYLHRDVAPDNIMVTADLDGLPKVKVIDLGLAKRFSGDLDLTQTGMFVGKVLYAAPEQFARPKMQLTPTADLYAFGLVFHKLLTGRSPIEGSSFEEVVAEHIRGFTPDFDVSDPDGRISPALRRILGAVLERNPADRPASAEAVFRLLAPLRPTEVPLFRDIERRTDPTSADDALQRAAARARARADSRGIAATLDMEVPGDGATPGSMGPTRHLSGGPNQTWIQRTWARWAGAWAVRMGSLSVSGLRRLLIWTAPTVLLIGLAWTQRDSATLRTWFEGRAPSTADLPVATAPGRLVIQAAPWGEVTEIRHADGELVALDPEGVFTPTVLILPSGGYQVTVEHPAGAPQTVNARVSPSGVERLSLDLVPADARSYVLDEGAAWLDAGDLGDVEPNVADLGTDGEAGL